MKNELTRTKSLFYSMYALKPMLLTAEVAKRYGVDLYRYSVQNKNLQLALDFHVPYIVNPSSWPYPQVSAFDFFGVGIYEMAFTELQKSPYENVVNSRQRPIKDWQVASYITLTHGRSDHISPVSGTRPVAPNSLAVAVGP